MLYVRSGVIAVGRLAADAWEIREVRRHIRQNA